MSYVNARTAERLDECGFVGPYTFENLLEILPAGPIITICKLEIIEDYHIQFSLDSILGRINVCGRAKSPAQSLAYAILEASRLGLVKAKNSQQTIK